jgi:hypothetical protein
VEVLLVQKIGCLVSVKNNDKRIMCKVTKCSGAPR